MPELPLDERDGVRRHQLVSGSPLALREGVIDEHDACALGGEAENESERARPGASKRTSKRVHVGSSISAQELLVDELVPGQEQDVVEIRETVDRRSVPRLVRVPLEGQEEGRLGDGMKRMDVKREMIRVPVGGDGVRDPHRSHLRP